MPFDGWAFKGRLQHFSRRFVVGEILLQQLVKQQVTPARLVGIVIRKHLVIVLQNQPVGFWPEQDYAISNWCTEFENWPVLVILFP